MAPPLKIGVCTGPANDAAAREAGADFLEVNVQNFLVPGDEEARFAPFGEMAAKSALPILAANCFLPASLPCVGPAVDDAALLAYSANTFSRAAKVGIRHIVFGSGGARKIPDGFSLERAREQFLGLLKMIAPLAEQAGVTLVIEPLNTKECNFINTLAEGAKMVEACAHPSVGLLADTYHMGFSGEGPETMRQFGQHLRHFHYAEYPSRRYPGADGTSYREWFGALREIGYTGAVSMECSWTDFAHDAGLAMANTRRDLAASGLVAA